MCSRSFSISNVAVVLFGLLLCYSSYNIYEVLNPPECSGKACLTPLYDIEAKLDLWVYSTPKKVPTKPSDYTLLVSKSSIQRKEEFSIDVNVTLPESTAKNGSLYAFFFLGPSGKSPLKAADRKHMSVAMTPLTKYAVPKMTAFNLLSDNGDTNETSEGAPVAHWKPAVTIHSLFQDWKFDPRQIPVEFNRIISLFPQTYHYLPILYVNEMKTLKKDLQMIESPLTREGPTNSMPLTITYSPVGIGRIRLWIVFGSSMEQMKKLGFGDNELDDVKEIFLGNINLLFLTIFVSMFHLLFDFLAFKNDISFWRKRKTMVGLSTRVVVWRCFTHVVVFLYLNDEKSSLLITVPAGIAAAIEVWKVRKALRLHVVWWHGFFPTITVGERLSEEKETEEYDSQAMQYLSYALYPLVIAAAVYSLLYSSHKSWYSWIIHSLVNGVYAFGFLFMLPQLFVNYKMKSVAHLPWRAFMYKAFNTFIDDVFAFIITMPTAHRVAVFRDDLVFLVYLYQRWLYPVDKSRVNEFGESFKEHEE